MTFKRPGETPQSDGFRFEKFFADLLGVEPTKGSGSQWTAKMDIADGSILWSLKHSAKDLLRFGQYRMRDLIREAEQAINGQGGVGGSTIPAVATSEDGVAYVTFRAEDFLRMAEKGDFKYIVMSKGAQKRARSRIPAILRDEE